VTAASFTALGDATRRRILELLADGPQAVGTLVTALAAEHPISQPAVSQHLRVLRDAGLVRVRPDGTRRLYTLDPDGIEAANAWLTRLLERPAPFQGPLDALDTELARGRRRRRTGPATPDRRSSRDAAG
jgi:DNA-binding transcriptional ArsR family regulator